MLAVLRFAENPRDRVAGFRVLQLLPGLGPTTAGRVLDHVQESDQAASAIATCPVPARAAEDWPAFADLVEKLGRGSSGWPAEMAQVRNWYEPHLDRVYEDAAIRQGDLVQLEQIAGGYPSRQRFLTELTLDPPSATSDQPGVPHLDEDYLILSTIHSAKGQEWKIVHVLNVVDGCMPIDLRTGSKPEIEEERRLLYVAMTRAKDDLHLVMPQRFFVHQQVGNGDRHVYAQRTRFIPPSILPSFEMRSWPESQQAGAAARSAPLTPIDIKAKMRGMWR
jgi:DNA helicase-2/ATP-dependent DNA helicase PcrA